MIPSTQQTQSISSSFNWSFETSHVDISMNKEWGAGIHYSGLLVLLGTNTLPFPSKELLLLAHLNFDLACPTEPNSVPAIWSLGAPWPSVTGPSIRKLFLKRHIFLCWECHHRDCVVILHEGLAKKPHTANFLTTNTSKIMGCAGSYGPSSMAFCTAAWLWCRALSCSRDHSKLEALHVTS